jgi:hypothetical protein
MNIVIKGLSSLPLGEAMGAFQRVVQQVQKQQGAQAIQTPANGTDKAVTN